MFDQNVFFIVGSQRSGTTLLSVMLSQHPDVLLDKNSIGFRLVECFNNYKEVLPYNLHHSWEELQAWLIDIDYKGRLKNIISNDHFSDFSDAKSLINAGISDYLDLNKKSILGDKSPNLQYFTNEINALIPNSKFIHIVRDGRAVALSRRKRANKNIYLSAQEWVDDNVMGLHHLSVLGSNRYLFVSYEDLLIDPEDTLKRISAFLEIEFDSKMLEKKAKSNEKNEYVKSIIDTSKINSFKNELSKRQIRKIERIQGPMLKRMGYELINSEMDESYRQMTIVQRLFYSQVQNVRQLMFSNIEGMSERKLIRVHVPFKTRVKAFFLTFSRDFFPDRIYKRILRKKKIGNVYFKARSKKL